MTKTTLTHCNPVNTISQKQQYEHAGTSKFVAVLNTSTTLTEMIKVLPQLFVASHAGAARCQPNFEERQPEPKTD